MAYFTVLSASNTVMDELAQKLHAWVQDAFLEACDRFTGPEADLIVTEFEGRLKESVSEEDKEIERVEKKMASKGKSLDPSRMSAFRKKSLKKKNELKVFRDGVTEFKKKVKELKKERDTGKAVSECWCETNYRTEDVRKRKDAARSFLSDLKSVKARATGKEVLKKGEEPKLPSVPCMYVFRFLSPFSASSLSPSLSQVRHLSACL